MKISVAQLPAALARGLSSAYLIGGEEPLQMKEAADAIRRAATARGFTDRKVFQIERGFSWDEVYAETRALSLFSTQQLFELRFLCKPDKKGADLLTELMSHPTADQLFLLTMEQFDRKALDAPWASAIVKHGTVVQVWPIEPAALPGWLKARAARAGYTLEESAAHLLSERAEGNLLAAAQELDKLELAADGKLLDLAAVKAAVGQSARYDVFALAQSAAAGEAPRAARVLAGLQHDGVEPTLILWALVREIRGLWQFKERERLKRGSPSGWNVASDPSSAARARLPQLPIERLLESAAQVDLIVKGQAPGEPWAALTALAMGLAGALPANLLAVPATR
jgi:DNA polymerase III subunit delta